MPTRIRASDDKTLEVYPHPEQGYLTLLIEGPKRGTQGIVNLKGEAVRQLSQELTGFTDGLEGNLHPATVFSLVKLMAAVWKGERVGVYDQLVKIGEADLERLHQAATFLVASLDEAMEVVAFIRERRERLLAESETGEAADDNG